ncbi:MAG TPA: DinB family protein [Terracidiphilus sp.]|nr:DinB family protein [Terracidiphilus sp.]
MLSMIQELIRHKWWANANLLHAIEQHPAAAEDEELSKMLHHILVANRFWLLTILEHSFVRENEMKTPENLADIIDRFSETQRLESEWLSHANESDLERTLETRTSQLGINVSVRQAILQICLHTQGHRSQCATRLRALGGTPPGMDYVLWIREQTMA